MADLFGAPMLKRAPVTLKRTVAIRHIDFEDLGTFQGCVYDRRDAVESARSYASSFIFCTTLPPRWSPHSRGSASPEDDTARIALAKRAASLKGEMPSQSVMIGEAAFESDHPKAHVRGRHLHLADQLSDNAARYQVPLHHRNEDEEAVIATLVSDRNAFPRWREFTDAERSNHPCC